MKRIIKNIDILFQFFLKRELKFVVVSVLAIFIFSKSELGAQAAFDTSFTVDSIIISGNKKTKTGVIMRELEFGLNDTITDRELEVLLDKSRSNLLNMPLFNFVYIDTVQNSEHGRTVNIKVEERWYTWPIFTIDPIDRNLNAWIRTRDISRVNIGLGVEKYNFLGLNHKVYAKTIFGYGNSFSFAYNDAYIGKNRVHALSFYANSVHKKTLDYDIVNDKPVTIKFQDKNAIEYTNFAIGYKYRKKINNSHIVYLNYKEYKIDETLFELNSKYLNGQNKSIAYFDISYNFHYTKKDSRSYPLKGQEVMFSATKSGLGIIKNSGVNQLSIKTEYSQYSQIYKRLYLASKITCKKNFGNNDNFLFRTGLGYGDKLRGYEHYLINSTGFVLLNTDLKFEIIKPKVFLLEMNGIKKYENIYHSVRKFSKIPYSVYVNFFADAAYASDDDKNSEYKNNVLVNSFIMSYGAGINIVTYYDLVIRLEFAVNKFKETGVILNFTAPF